MRPLIRAWAQSYKTFRRLFRHLTVNLPELGRLNKRLKFYKFGPWSYPVYTCVYCMSWVCKNVTWLHENEVKPFKMQHSVMIFFLFFFRLCFGLCQSQSRNQLKRSVFAHNQVLNFQFMSGESDPPIIFNNHLCFAVNILSNKMF